MWLVLRPEETALQQKNQAQINRHIPATLSLDTNPGNSCVI